MSVEKIEISPVVPTKITHHRELPAGQYYVVLSGFQSKLYLIKEYISKKMYLIEWGGKAKLKLEFNIKEDGTLQYYEVGRWEDGYPG